jgi:hypothetical protein
VPRSIWSPAERRGIRILTAIVLTGFALQIAGVLISAVGFWRTWHEFGPPGQWFFSWFVDPVREALRSTVSSVESLLRRLVRRPKPITGYADVGFRFGIKVGRPTVFVMPGPLSEDVPAAIRELDKRIRDLIEKLAVLDSRHADDFDKRDEAIAKANREIDEAVARLERRGQRIAIGGLRAQTLGLTLIGFGLMLHMWAFWSQP